MNNSSNTLSLLEELEDLHNTSRQKMELDRNVTFEFIIHGIFVTGTCILGFFTNTICLLVMNQPRPNHGKGSVVNVVLTSVACVDLALLTSSFFMCGLPGIVKYRKHFWKGNNDRIITWLHEISPIVTVAIYPVGMVAQTASIYLTVVVTVERYVAVCWPLKARFICTRTRTKVAILLVCIFSIAYNIPRFMEYDYISVYLDDRVRLYWL